MRNAPRWRGQRVGLLGGSFNPAHAGHVHISVQALARLQLDAVWWLVSPQNPLKPKSSPLADRVASARRQARGAKMVVTDLEQRLRCAYTYQTLRALRRLYPGVRFVLIMGADNLATFRKWRNWREVASALPVAVVSRPDAGPRLRLAAPRGWTYLNARHHRQSSTTLRQASAKPRAPVAKRRGK